MAKASSSGHKLGQLVGDWWEEYVVLPLLADIAKDLDLYLDHRFRERSCREGAKIIWEDENGNKVDYDFVLELNGSDKKEGIPVGFVEVFWRRGARHSKDKARDDSGKLMPMRQTYPTARYLGVAACGSLTGPAREYIKLRDIDLFYVPKSKIIEAYSKNGLTIDYPDRLGEEEKAKLAEEFGNNFDNKMKKKVSDTLKKVIGKATIQSYKSKISSSLSALPQEIRFQEANKSEYQSFESIKKATEFLKNPHFEYKEGDESYIYEITYSDGYEFSREVDSLTKLRELHTELVKLINHMEKIS
ncbi:MAG: hypothetical protein MK198_12590 [Gracilimonas sp.]|uniref:hypothetical protein n=1 Tax=Gracilimonas sp. TaxID=1974203 RepID=UPI003750E1E7|nr:hypothetical protein [Gracilimonas sp.]